MKTRLIIAGTIAVAALGLAGCSSNASAPASTTPATTAAATPTPTAEVSKSASAADTAPKSKEQLEAALLAGGFDAGEYDSTQAMLDGIYSGLTAEDPTCLLPFGVGWENDPALITGDTAWGPSVDQSMSAVIASPESDYSAKSMMSTVSKAVTSCTSGDAQYAFQGMPVELKAVPADVEVEGADEAQSWTAAASVAGVSVKLTGMIARAGAVDVMIVGWKGDEANTTVPLAMKEIIGAL